ncbi:hypothetical protein NKJ16_23495 [Mesorhizobium sp. M0179]|uniref:hypothetical protein n=1 Tax=Mesorhizobium sp. M0179 TaxID=2956905 RepID=UPI0033376D1E
MNFDDTTVQQLGAQAYGHYKAGEKNYTKAMEHAKSAGLYLIEAKKRVGTGKFVAFLADHCPISKSRAYEFIAIAEGRKSPSAEADRVREWRQKQAGVRQLQGQSVRTETRNPSADSGRERLEAMARELIKRLSTAQLENWIRLAPAA